MKIEKVLPSTEDCEQPGHNHQGDSSPLELLTLRDSKFLWVRSEQPCGGVLFTAPDDFLKSRISSCWKDRIHDRGHWKEVYLGALAYTATHILVQNLILTKYYIYLTKLDPIFILQDNNVKMLFKRMLPEYF